MKPLLFTILLLVLVIPVLAQETLPALDDLDAGWNSFSPGGETRCGRGTPYHFYVRPAEDGNTEKLLVYFQGGGACWNILTCRVDGGTFDDSVSANPEDELGFYNGIFDFENPENPIADYNVVFIPYCTADVHVGDATVEYVNGLEIHHNGFKNTSAVLDWVYDNFDAPQEIFITGSSAGAYGSIYHAPFIIDQYPDARVVQNGDAGVGATPVGWEALQDWGMFENIPIDVDPETFDINVLYDTYATTYPDVSFSQYTTSADEVQVQFYNFSKIGSDDERDWTDVMYANLDELEAAHENYRSLVVGGTSHTILASPEFYTYAANGVRVRDWFADLIAGNPVENVRCESCDDAEVLD
jgi:hypothetical protein